MIFLSLSKITCFLLTWGAENEMQLPATYTQPNKKGFQLKAENPYF
jgi:hypothetical protein